MKIVISIPVHEKEDVIKNQIENFQKYIKGVYIVLHVSKSYQDFEALKEGLKVYSDVYVNPERLETKWGDIVQPHVSNYHYISSILQFDYFVLHASNDMYIKHGFEEYISKYKAGFAIRKVVQKYTNWWPGDLAQRDEQLKYIMQQTGQGMIIATQVESSFYNKELMDKIVKIIDASETYRNEELVYTREEIFFSTIASALVDWNEIGDVTTFSEVHRFDRTLWKFRARTRKLFYRSILKFFMTETMYYKLEDRYNTLLFKKGWYKTSKRTVNKLLNNDMAYIQKNSYLNDGSGNFRLYGQNIFSVKRVQRDIDNKLRKYITGLE